MWTTALHAHDGKVVRLRRGGLQAAALWAKEGVGSSNELATLPAFGCSWASCRGTEAMPGWQLWQAPCCRFLSCLGQHTGVPTG